MRGSVCHGDRRCPSDLKASSLIFEQRAFFVCLSPSHTPPSPPTHTCQSLPSLPRSGFSFIAGVSSPWRELVGGHRPEKRKETVLSRRSRAGDEQLSEGLRQPQSGGPGPCRSSASPFLIFLVFHPSVASLSAAASQESSESLVSLLAVAVASSSFHSNPAAFVPSGISSASVPHLRLFPVPLFKSWNKR